MSIYHIVAASGDGAIGFNNQLPWPKISADWKHFRATTDGSTVIMGRHTFESINSKPLPNRENIVLSHSSIQVPGITVCGSVEEAFKKASKENIFIIGGADVFRQTINVVDGVYMTQIYEKYPADVCYPKLPTYFVEVKRELLPTNPGEPKAEKIFYINKLKHPDSK